MSRADEILEFWFGPDPARIPKDKSDAWFVKNPEFDQQCQRRYLTDVEEAASGGRDSWIEAPRTCLALILLLDQFPRNIFRDTPSAFATDPKALAAARHAVSRGFDVQLTPSERSFVYMPFMHSEDLRAQHESVKLFTQLEKATQSSGTPYAKRHCEVIDRFGRFPHRNSILGRTSTPKEIEFLARTGSGF
jgi:uncharacterized protein (DUF924 family)